PREGGGPAGGGGRIWRPHKLTYRPRDISRRNRARPRLELILKPLTPQPPPQALALRLQNRVELRRRRKVMRVPPEVRRLARMELPLIFVKRVAQRLGTLPGLPGGKTENLGDASPGLIHDLEIDFHLDRNVVHEAHMDEHSHRQWSVKTDTINLDRHENLVAHAPAQIPAREERKNGLEACIEHRRMQSIVGHMREQPAWYPDLSQVFPAPAPQSFHSLEGRAVVESGHRETSETFLAIIGVRAAPLDLREVKHRTEGLGAGPEIN